jgi:hypothetical protein
VLTGEIFLGAIRGNAMKEALLASFGMAMIF